MRSSPAVAAASAMKLATSMWSGQIACMAPPNESRPCTVIMLEPIPSTAAPILVSSRARSWTCGSQAAFLIVVGPGVSAAAGAELPEGIEVRVEPSPADQVAAGWWHPGLAEAGEKRTGEQEGRPDPARELLVESGVGHRAGAEAKAVLGHPAHVDPEPLQKGNLGLGVADPRH